MNELKVKTLHSANSASKGQKLQSTVRFESETYRRIEQIQLNSGVSFAEAARRLVRKGLEKSDEVI
jgi:hypothetical protein